MVVFSPSTEDIFHPTEKSYARISQVLEVPNLIQIQTASFEWFKSEGLKELIQEITPIVDFTGGRFDLHFLEHEFHDPKYTEQECRQREITYAAPLYVTARLDVKETGEKLPFDQKYLDILQYESGNWTMAFHVASSSTFQPGLWNRDWEI